MRVCDIAQSFSPRSGGVKRYLTNKIGFFAERPDVDHLLIRPGPRDRQRIQGRSRVYEMGSPLLPGSLDYRLLADRRRIFEMIQRESPDVIEVDSAYTAAWFGLAAGYQFEIPVVGFYHSDFPRRLPEKVPAALSGLGKMLAEGIDRYLLALHRRMDATVVATEKYDRLLADIGVPRRVRIPLGVNTAVFRPLPGRERIRRMFGVPEDSFLLLFTGRLAGMKHLDGLIGMMAELSQTADDCHLVIAGDGEERETVQRAASEREDVTWAAYVADRDRLAELYSAADLFVHAGTMETFGLVSLEAQACGTRVIAVRGGGMEETLHGEDPIILAESPDPGELARAVRSARALAEGQGDRERRRLRIVREFSWETTFRRLLDLYDRLRREDRSEFRLQAVGAEGFRNERAADSAERRASKRQSPR
jgi:alpha-1,6-mannosyltransferase